LESGFITLWRLALEGKAGLEHNLVVANLAILDVSAGLHDLKPVQISQRLDRAQSRSEGKAYQAAG
jgi:hypothetical protein